MSGCRIVHAVIRGRVQGVGYRAWTRHQADLHGLEGWVRNRRDGSVEAVFAGAPDLVEVMLKTCRDGPRFSRVDAVEVQEGDEALLAERGAGDGFSVLSTL